jgi:NO-binding membrane sensor protein with MHYT domain
VLTVHNFSFGVLTPVAAYVMSCLGAFIALRCTTRASAYQGAAKVRWLLLAAVSLGTTGIWVMHFIAMLGYSIPGMVIHYNVLVTIGSLVIAVIVVAVGLLIVGLGKPGWRNLLLAGVITGIGVASMHYSGMLAMEVPARMSYRPGLFGVSIVIAIVAATAALWAALRLRGVLHTLIASMIMGVAVSGMHYTGMAAMQMRSGAGGMTMSGPTAASFVLPLVIGIGVVSIIMTGALAFSPSNEEIMEDAQLKARIDAANARLGGAQPQVPLTPPSRQARWPGHANGAANGGAANGGAANSGAPNGGAPNRASANGHHNGAFEPAPRRGQRPLPAGRRG